MKFLMRMVAVVALSTGSLLFSGEYFPEPASAETQQLQGDAAWEFLTAEGILPQLMSAPPQGRHFGEPPPTIASDGLAGDRFGFSVAMDGDTAVVGAPQVDFNGNNNQGAVYIFTHDGMTWDQQQKLITLDGEADDLFGFSVAVAGDTVIIGAYQADEVGVDNQGAAYVFTRSGTTWSEQDKLTPGDGAAGDSFGYSVAVAGDTAVVGAVGVDISGENALGAAYVFTRSGTSWSEEEKIVAGDGAENDNFGWSVGLSDGTVVVGSPGADVNGINRGAGYVFTRSGTTWSEQDKLIATDGALDNIFGWSVALDGDTAVVGAPGAEVGGNNLQGAAYVFTRNGTSWSQQDKLSSADGMSGDEFGKSLSLDGETIVVGASSADVNGVLNQGTAYIFTRSETTWSEQQKLVAVDGAELDNFGIAVAITDDVVVIGANQADLNNEDAVGKVYLAERGPVPWPQTSNLVANDGTGGDQFGYSVAIDGDTAVVGASFVDVGGGSGQGVAYIFTRNGPIWVQQERLIASDGEAGDRFGYAVGVAGDTAVVGAYLAHVSGNTNQGAAYVFTRSGTTWTEQDKLSALDGLLNDHFGISVAVAGDTVVVGAAEADFLGGSALDQGAAYVFSRSGTTWTEQQKLLAGDGAEGDRFGRAVALDGDTLAIGAYRADVDNEEVQGAVYVFTRTGTTWTEQDKLVAIDGAAMDNFGIFVALDGDTTVVGADRADVDGAEDQGAAYVFTRTGSTWDEKQKLLAGDGTEFDEFGQSVALSGDRIVVGALADDAGGRTSQGSAYVFTRSGMSWNQEQKLLPDDGLPGDFFGFAVAVFDDTAVVGSFLADVGANDDQGRVYFFTRQPFFDIYLPLLVKD